MMWKISMGRDERLVVMLLGALRILVTGGEGQ